MGIYFPLSQPQTAPHSPKLHPSPTADACSLFPTGTCAPQISRASSPGADPPPPQPPITRGRSRASVSPPALQAGVTFSTKQGRKTLFRAKEFGDGPNPPLGRAEQGARPPFPASVSPVAARGDALGRFSCRTGELNRLSKAPRASVWGIFWLGDEPQPSQRGFFHLLWLLSRGKFPLG